MAVRDLRVRVLAPLRRCHVRLPRALLTSLCTRLPASWAGSVPLRLSTSASTTSVYVGATRAHVASRSDVLEIAPAFAASLDLADGDIVSVSLAPLQPIVARVFVRPQTPDDWDVLSANAARVEHELLEQVDVIMPSRAFPLFLPSSASVLLLHVVGCNDTGSAFVRLGTGTELVVEPRVRDRTSTAASVRLRVAPSTSSSSSTSRLVHVTPACLAALGCKRALLRVDERSLPVDVASSDTCRRGHVLVPTSLALPSFTHVTLIPSSSSVDVASAPEALDAPEDDRRDVVIAPGVVSVDVHHDLRARVKWALKGGGRGVCLVGPVGVGKSVAVRALLAELKTELCGSAWLACADMASDKLDDIRAAVNGALCTALMRAPAVLVLDDLDKLIPVAEENDASNALRSLKLAEFVNDALLALRARSAPVACVATARSMDALHPSLSTSLPVTLTLSPPDRFERVAILRRMLADHAIDWPDVDAEELAAATEGFVGRDLYIVVQRVLHATISRHLDVDVERKLTAINDDFVNALKAYVPLALQGIALHKSDTKWCDIGGLEEVRSALIETLELPTKFAALFEQVPLKLRSGLLLYGPPGCGKTLLASAVARECGLNFISVKGPELLNKYIGASEQAVRDVFGRAAAAAPCVLFFDEFDAIAPRRGADSTGVTDRVVNQMLCHLDGVESRVGVYVLAATSRPDLMDPALLRPGRLDKCLYCGMPDEDARLRILEALSRRMTLDDDVELDVIAARTRDFTGADLQGLLNSAQLIAVHQVIDRRRQRDDDGEEDDQVVSINNAVLLQALSDARLSVSAPERRRYQKIYAAFVGSQASDFSLQFREGHVKLRTALS